jgi:lambda repressor-like predicted transcriptional regulator
MKEYKLFKDNYNLYLKQQMMVNGVGMRELSKKTGYSYEGIRQILNGRGSYKGVFKICKVLQLNMKKLLKENVLGKSINN